MILMPFIILWILLALTVLVLFLWRTGVARKEDDNLHVMDLASVAKPAEQAVAEQAVVAQKLAVIDKWGKITTIVVVAYGLILGVVYVYWSWVQNSHMGV